MLKKIAGIAALALAADVANAADWSIDAYHRIDERMSAPARQGEAFKAGGFGLDVMARIAKQTAEFVERGAKVEPHAGTGGTRWNTYEDVYTRLAG